MDKFLLKFERWLIPGVAVLCINILPAWYVLTHLSPPERLKYCIDWLPTLNAATINAGTFSLGIVYAVLLGFVLDSLKIYQWYPGSEKLKWKMRRKIIEGFGIACTEEAMKKNAEELSKKLHDHIIKGSYGDIDEKVRPFMNRADIAVIVMQCCVILELELTVMTFVLHVASSCLQFFTGVEIGVATAVALGAIFYCSSMFCDHLKNNFLCKFLSVKKIFKLISSTPLACCFFLVSTCIAILMVEYYDKNNIKFIGFAVLIIMTLLLIILFLKNIEKWYTDTTELLHYLIKLKRYSDWRFFSECLLDLAQQKDALIEWRNGSYHVKSDLRFSTHVEPLPALCRSW